MKFVRLQRCKELLEFWPFFVEGIDFTAKYLHYKYSYETYRRILQKLVVTPSAFVAVVTDDDGKPLCFGAASDATPLFGTEREYDIHFFYHNPEYLPATGILWKQFERFCRRTKVKRYTLSTTAFNGMAQKCFPKYGFVRDRVVFKHEVESQGEGFQRSHIVFKRELR